MIGTAGWSVLLNDLYCLMICTVHWNVTTYLSAPSAKFRNKCGEAFSFSFYTLLWCWKGKSVLLSFYYCSFFDDNFRLFGPPCLQYRYCTLPVLHSTGTVQYRYCAVPVPQVCTFPQVTSLMIFFSLLQIYFHLVKLANFRPTDCCNLSIISGKINATAPFSYELRSNNRPCLWFTYIRQPKLIQYNSQCILSGS
jgi:hypothetical protein